MPRVRRRHEVVGPTALTARRAHGDAVAVRATTVGNQTNKEPAVQNRAGTVVVDFLVHRTPLSPAKSPPAPAVLFVSRSALGRRQNLHRNQLAPPSAEPTKEERDAMFNQAVKEVRMQTLR